jgi:hypothetical protein
MLLLRRRSPPRLRLWHLAVEVARSAATALRLRLPPPPPLPPAVLLLHLLAAPPLVQQPQGARSVRAPPVLAVLLAVVPRLHLPLLLLLLRLLRRRHQPPRPRSRSRVKVASLVRRNSKKIIMPFRDNCFFPLFLLCTPSFSLASQLKAFLR